MVALVSKHKEMTSCSVPVKCTETTRKYRDIPIFSADEVLRFLWDEVGVKVSSKSILDYWTQAKQAGVPWAQHDYSTQPGGWPIPLKIFGDDATFNQHLGFASSFSQKMF